MALSETLRRWREAAGVTQDALAHQLDVSSRTIQNWEAGETEPSLSHYVRIAAVLGVSEEDWRSAIPSGEVA